MILVDTSILIDHLRGREEARTQMRAILLAGSDIAGSVVTKVEVIGPMRSTERPAVRALFSLVEWLPVTEQIAERAGGLAREYRRSHGSIDVIDYIIAATALESGAALWTRNVRHFPMFAGLESPY